MAIGILYLFLTFVICFSLVHLVRLAYLGLKSVKKKAEPPKEKEKPAPEPKPKKPEPVYYIVEKSGQKSPIPRRKKFSLKINLRSG